MVIRHNLQAMSSQRQLGITASHKQESQEKLSSGYAVNRAADDAAGLSISEKMRRQIRGLNRASLNARDGISLVQIADGALVEVHDMLQRGNELSVQAANGTNSESDREAINAEIVQIKTEIDAITSRTKFNELEVFSRKGEWPRIQQVNPNKAAKQAMEALAKKISDEFVPNAVAQIVEKIGPLGEALKDRAKDPHGPYEMTMNLDYIDGTSKTLAYVQAGFRLPSEAFAEGSLLLKVDKDDFPSLNLSEKDLQMLESTIAHEMMHGVMDVVFPERMHSGGDTAKDFPEWFIEGTAQLTGGGFTTGWNDMLHRIVNEVNGEDAQKEAITKYLTGGYDKANAGKYTVDNRVYGHGYLAAAYAGYLAAGGNTIDSATLQDGAGKIFAAFISSPDSSFDAVMAGAMGGVTVAQLKDAINNGSDDELLSGKLTAVEFVRQLSLASKGGAGSIITDALNTGGSKILGDTAKKDDQPIRISAASTDYYEVPDTSYKGSDTIKLHIGADAENGMEVKHFCMNSKALELTDTNVLSADQATAAINDFGHAILLVSSVRSYYGAIQNRLEHTIRNLDNVAENTTAAESRIRDTDIPKEMVALSRINILEQAGFSILAQANQSTNGILALL